MSKAVELTTEQRQANYERQNGARRGLTVKQERQIRRQERRRLAVARRRAQ